MFEAIKMCGPTAWVTLALAAAALIASVLALLSKNVVTMRVSFALIVAVALSGVFGTWRGRRVADYGRPGAEQRAGYDGAAQCTDAAIRVGALPLVFAWIAAARIGYALSRKRAGSDTAPSAKDG